MNTKLNNPTLTQASQTMIQTAYGNQASSVLTKLSTKTKLPPTAQPTKAPSASQSQWTQLRSKPNPLSNPLLLNSTKREKLSTLTKSRFKSIKKTIKKRKRYLQLRKNTFLLIMKNHHIQNPDLQSQPLPPSNRSPC